MADEEDEISKYREHLDALAEPRREKIRKDAKRSAVWCVGLGAAILLISNGMPGHHLARWVGVPLTIAFVVAFGLLLFTGANIASDWLLRRR